MDGGLFAGGGIGGRSEALLMPPQQNADGAKSKGTAMDGLNKFDIPQDLRAMAESSVEQARKAFDTFLSAAHRTAQTVEGQSQVAREGAKDLGMKAISFAEKNVAASLDYAERLIRAKDVSEVLRLHNDYVQDQIRTLADQAQELGQTVTRSAMDATKPH